MKGRTLVRPDENLGSHLVKLKRHMTKIRIYELAKELGVDNKIVINKAIELGFPGKSSHSHSLEADEADQIRRAVIRQAIGNAPAEVVKSKVTEEGTSTVVERRKGNIIRRRREEPVAEAPAQVIEEPQIAAPVEVVVPQIESEIEPQVKSQEQATEETAAPIEQVSTAVVSESQTPKAGEAKKIIGPKILGKIDLPVRRLPKTEVKAKSSESVIVDPEEEKLKSKVKKRKKVEFSRGQLVDYEGRDRKGRAGGKGRGREEELDKKNIEGTAPRATKKILKIAESISVGDLAKQMSLKAGDVISKLMELGIMATINHSLDQVTAQLVVEELGFEFESSSFDEAQMIKDDSTTETEDVAALRPRPPVVTVMGHVDHGKTSLLDNIRSAAVAAKEAGGITQHIGAYTVKVKERSITFIDTPGHAAFTSMRARGAQVTDIVILVVAADDGVMPQTVEAINHAKAAGVPIIVAINKMDKHGAQPDKVKQRLVEQGLQPEDWGGDTMYFPVSALKGTGVRELLEGVLLLADVKELKANPDKRARGTIIEARQDRGRGRVCTVLVQSGTLRVGDMFVTGSEMGRVRSMQDHMGTKLKEAGPSMPVEITGLDELPGAGDDFLVLESEDAIKDIVYNRQQIKAAKERSLAAGPISLEEFARRANDMAAAELNVIIKADVHGSLEAVKQSLEQVSTPKVKVKVVHFAVGGITESDIQLALASKAIVIGFGVRAESRAQEEAERFGIQLRFYRIIYDVVEDIKKAMAGLLEPLREEVKLGRAEVRETFSIPKMGVIAGCYVADGQIKRGAFVRLLRDSQVVYEGKMGSLRRFKEDVKEVNSGYECGIGIERFNDIKIGDQIEVFEVKEIAQTL